MPPSSVIYNEVPSPPVSPPVANLLREVANYFVMGSPISPSSMKMLESSLNGYQNRIQLVMAAMTSQRVLRMASTAAAMDLCLQWITDPNYLTQVKGSPSELRKYMRLLMELDQGDVELLRSQAAPSAEKEGFSRDPTLQMNYFFGSGPKQTVLPPDLTVDERRKARAMIEEFYDMLQNRGGLPAPPKPPVRVLSGVDGGNGTGGNGVGGNGVGVEEEDGGNGTAP